MDPSMYWFHETAGKVYVTDEDALHAVLETDEVLAAVPVYGMFITSMP